MRLYTGLEGAKDWNAEGKRGRLAEEDAEDEEDEEEEEEDDDAGV